MTKSEKFHPSMHQKRGMITTMSPSGETHPKELQREISREGKFISFPSPAKIQNMSAGKLIYFHYDVLLCLFSAFFNIHFPRTTFCLRNTIENSLYKTFFIHFPYFCCKQQRAECTMV